MEFYSKKEFNQMKSSLERIIKSKDKEIAKLNEKIKQYKIDYDVLLETSTEEIA